MCAPCTNNFDIFAQLYSSPIAHFSYSAQQQTQVPLCTIITVHNRAIGWMGSWSGLH